MTTKTKNLSDGTSVVTQYNENKTKVSSAEHNAENQKHGTERGFFEDGETVNWKTEYVNGEKHGESTLYRKDGTIEAREHYKNNKLHGTATVYGKDGKEQSKAEYVNGEITENKEAENTNKDA